MNEIQELEFKILKKTIRFLEKNNLDYFLIGGTLLGAIRHKGFIPWDDDIDIGMKRDDYEELIKICTQNNGIIDDNLELLCYKNKNSIYPYCKIVDKSVKIKEKAGIDEYLWIDIFPYDNLPNSLFLSRIIYKKEDILKRLLLVNSLDREYLKYQSKNRIKYLIKLLFIKLFLNKINLFSFAKRMDKLAVKVNNKYINSKYVGCLVWGYGINERIYKNDLKLNKVFFEKDELNGIEGYDNYLSNLYGDYMKLPPEEKRISHSFVIERIDK